MSSPVWSINAMDRDLPDGTVTRIAYTASLTEGEATSSIVNTVELAPADPDRFIPYGDLTEDLVVGWVQQALGTELVAAYGTNLAAMNQEKLNPTHASGLPWVG